MVAARDHSTDGPWITQISRDDADGELAEAYRTVGHGRPVDNILAIHSLHPQLLLDHYGLYKTSMHGRSPLTRVEREAIAVVVSAANDCFY